MGCTVAMRSMYMKCCRWFRSHEQQRPQCLPDSLCPCRIWFALIVGTVCLLVFGIFRKHINIYSTRLVCLHMSVAVLSSCSNNQCQSCFPLTVCSSCHKCTLNLPRCPLEAYSNYGEPSCTATSSAQYITPNVKHLLLVMAVEQITAFCCE